MFKKEQKTKWTNRSTTHLYPNIVLWWTLTYGHMFPYNEDNSLMVKDSVNKMIDCMMLGSVYDD